MEYVHLPVLAPTSAMLESYRNKEIDWAAYEKQFLELMNSRALENAVEKELIAEACLLCSEAEPDPCHRRLVAEYLRDKWGELEIVHL